MIYNGGAYNVKISHVHVLSFVILLHVVSCEELCRMLTMLPGTVTCIIVLLGTVTYITVLLWSVTYITVLLWSVTFITVLLWSMTFITVL